ncbi:MAG TPA: GntR family transcriptional regulator [Solirubrobacterales bacterium]|nr:GntR family transcriptional regulator [Solirubrobacterales bacterium]
MSAEPTELPGPLWEVIVRRLRDRILNGELAPGAKLVEADLAADFGTSRGPVREAIRELAREGLVAELARRGTFVSTLTGHDLSEVYAVREALELGACKSAINRASDAELAALEPHLIAMEASWREGATYLESAVHDLAFHRAILALAGNQRMAAIYDQMLAQTMLLLRAAADENPGLRAEMRASAHRDILAALVARDEERARVAIAAHYRYAEERLFGRGVANQGRPGGSGSRPHT